MEFFVLYFSLYCFNISKKLNENFRFLNDIRRFCPIEHIWFSSNQTLINSNVIERIHVTYKETDFTHQAKLTILNVQKSDQGSYYCKAMDSQNNIDSELFQLTVYGNFYLLNIFITTHANLWHVEHFHGLYLQFADPEKPYFIESMNNSEQILTLKDAATGHRQLRCQAGGLPKPTIYWYKVNNFLIKTFLLVYTLSICYQIQIFFIHLLGWHTNKNQWAI